VRVDWAIPCRYAEVHPQSGATIIGAGADLIIAPQIPTPVQVLFVVRFVGAPEEVKGDAHPVTCRVLDPDGSEIGQQTAEITTELTQVVTGYVAEVTIPMGILLLVAQYGTYRVEWTIDGGDPLPVPIHVVEPPTAL